VRVFECDACGLVVDRDENAGHNLVTLATRTTCLIRRTGTGVAGDLDPTAVVGSKPRGADRKTRTTCPRRTVWAGRAGGTIPSPGPGQKRETVKDTEAQLALW
jgi:putative transposase